MEQLLIAFVQRVEWAQELLKENCGERKALWCARRRIPLPRRGMTRRLRCGGDGLQPYGVLDCFGWRSEGVQGGTVGSGYPVDTTAEGG